MKHPVSLNKTITWLCIFSIAMGFLESSVVIYLRELYYPNGFRFPLQVIPSKIAMVELCREVATIIMLMGAGFLAGTTKMTRFACFLMAFAIWDLFYYLFLFLFIQWPQSLFTWDILFLIPSPWTGPVIAPCLVSCGMIILAGFILKYNHFPGYVKISRLQWSLLIAGSITIIYSFLYDYFSIVPLQSQSFHLLPSSRDLLSELKSYIPNRFNWYIFFSGFFLSSLGTFSFIKTSSKNNKS